MEITPEEQLKFRAIKFLRKESKKFGFVSEIWFNSELKEIDSKIGYEFFFLKNKMIYKGILIDEICIIILEYYMFVTEELKKKLFENFECLCAKM